jgi:hypothetical protein
MSDPTPPVVKSKGLYQEFKDFMAKNPRHPYIVQWDKPKITNLKRLFANRLR